jgi:hypothetical protein
VVSKPQRVELPNLSDTGSYKFELGQPVVSPEAD